MGLLDTGIEDPTTAGLLSLGLRLMSTPGKFGTALGQAGLGALQDVNAAKDSTLKRKVMQTQLDDMHAQRELALQAALQKRGFLEQLARETGISIPGITPAASAPAPSPASIGNAATIAQTGNLAPTVSNGAIQSANTPAPKQPGTVWGLPASAVMSDLYFNDGKNIPKELMERSRPQMAFHNGILFDLNNTPVGTTIPTISQNGQASQPVKEPTAPGGWRIVAPPGAVDTFNAYQTAEQQAKAPYTIVQVPSSSGSTRPMQLSAFIGGKGAGPAAAPAGPVGSTSGGKGAPAVGGEVWGRTPTAAEIADQETAKKTKEERGKSFSELEKSLMNQAFTAPAQLRKLERIQQLLDGVDGGKLAPLGLEVASLANSIGIKLDPKLGNKEASQALAREIAGGFRQPGTGPMTDKDFENFLTQVPDLSKSAEGRRQIVQTTRAAIARDIQISKMARDYIDQHGALNYGFQSQVAQFIAENPVVPVSSGWKVLK